jgi:hypothetical protein
MLIDEKTKAIRQGLMFLIADEELPRPVGAAAFAATLDLVELHLRNQIRIAESLEKIAVRLANPPAFSQD